MDFFNCEELLWIPITIGTTLDIIDNKYCRILTRLEWQMHKRGEKLNRLRISDRYSIPFLQKHYEFSETGQATNETISALVGFWPTTEHHDFPEKSVLDLILCRTSFRKFQLT